MSVKRTSHLPEAVLKIEAASADALARCAIFLSARLREALAVPYPPASRPGEIPRKRTGRLQHSVAYTVDRKGMTARVGVSAAHGAYLERGTARMDARPFLLVTARRHIEALRRLAGTP